MWHTEQSQINALGIYCVNLPLRGGGLSFEGAVIWQMTEEDSTPCNGPAQIWVENEGG